MPDLQVVCALLAACFIVRTLASLRKRSSRPEKPAVAGPPLPAVTARLGPAKAGPAKSGRQPDAAHEGRPSTEEVWEQLLQEQAHRLRATAEAGAARFGAASAKPTQGRPPDAIVRLRRQRVKPMLGNGDSSSGDAAAYKTDESAERESHSERLVRDYRLWGRQGGMYSPPAAAGLNGASVSRQEAGEFSPRSSIPSDIVSQRGSGSASAPPQPSGSFSRGMAAAEQDKSGRAPDQRSVNPSSRTAVRRSVENTGAEAAGRGREKAFSKYKTEGREVYIRSGVWQGWGPVAAQSGAGDVKHDTVTPAQIGASVEDGVQLKSRAPPESPVSWGLIARSYASVQGKLSPVLRGQPGKAALREKALPAHTSAGTSGSRAGIAGETKPYWSQVKRADHEANLHDAQWRCASSLNAMKLSAKLSKYSLGIS